MKIVDANVGILTNFEVFDLLRSRGAEHGFVGAVDMATRSELKVYDYLAKTPASVQSRDVLSQFFKEPLAARLMKPERLQIVNLRPTSLVEVYLAVEDVQKRFSDEELEGLLARVAQTLPEPPAAKTQPMEE